MIEVGMLEGYVLFHCYDEKYFDSIEGRGLGFRRKAIDEKKWCIDLVKVDVAR